MTAGKQGVLASLLLACFRDRSCCVLQALLISQLPPQPPTQPPQCSGCKTGLPGLCRKLHFYCHLDLEFVLYMMCVPFTIIISAMYRQCVFIYHSNELGLENVIYYSKINVILF